MNCLTVFYDIDTDLLEAQSNGYRRMSANLYKTKNESEFFHIHGSLEATTTLNMIGLDGYRPDLTDYEEIIKVIEGQVQKYSAAELEDMNRESRQAGVTAYKHEDFIKTPHVGAFLILKASQLTFIGRTKHTRTLLESISSEGRPPSNSIPCQPHRQQKDPRRHQGLRIMSHHCWSNCHPHPVRIRSRRSKDHQP